MSMITENEELPETVEKSEEADKKPKSSMIAQALAEFDEDRAMILAVKEYGKLTLAIDGIGKVEEAHKQVRRLRINIPKRGKELRDGANAYCKAIIAEEKRLLEEVQPIEDALAAQRKIHDDEQDRIKEEKAKAKRAILQGRIEKLAQAGCVAGDIAELERMSDDEFSLHFLSERMKAESAREVAEQARLAAEKLEADRLAEVARQAEELRIRQEELDRDRKAMAAEREVMLQQQQIERRQLEEQQAEVKRQQNEIQAGFDRAARRERERVAAERQAEEKGLALVAAQKAEAAEAARLEALKPEIEKVAKFCTELGDWADRYLTDIGGPSWSKSALDSIERACIEIRRNVERGEL